MKKDPTFEVPPANFWDGNQFVIPGYTPGYEFPEPAPVPEPEPAANPYPYVAGRRLPGMYRPFIGGPYGYSSNMSNLSRRSGARAYGRRPMPRHPMPTRESVPSWGFPNIMSSKGFGAGLLDRNIVRLK